MGKMINFKRPDGQSVDGYLAEPATGSGAAAIVVIQDWWGLNDQIKGVADTLAGAGYRALVPDLYRGKVALAANEAEHLMNELNFGDAAGQDVRGAAPPMQKPVTPTLALPEAFKCAAAPRTSCPAASPKFSSFIRCSASFAASATLPRYRSGTRAR